MLHLTDIRLRAQQLAAPRFDDPVDLVRWMGMVQAQNYPMAKWAVGLRLRCPARSRVDDALRDGRLLRLHVMRPTWHFVAAEDDVWMMRLSARRIRSANASFARGHGVDLSDYVRCLRKVEHALRDDNHLTRPQLVDALQRMGMTIDMSYLKRLLMHAETDCVVCSGRDCAGTPTYALWAERVPAAAPLDGDEAAAVLARRYFSSHAPARLSDFSWWSGLPMTEARRAVESLGGELRRECFGGEEYLMHDTCSDGQVAPCACLLPSYDEYLIAYRDRSAVLADAHRSRAFNAYGLFYPVVLFGGRVVGRWREERSLRTEFFAGEKCPSDRQLRQAAERLSAYRNR